MNNFVLVDVLKNTEFKQYTFKTIHNCYVHVCKNFNNDLWVCDISYSYLTRQFNSQKWSDTFSSNDLHACFTFLRERINDIKPTFHVYDELNQLNLFDFMED